MKQIKRYTCDLCGDIFYDRWECYEHFHSDHLSIAKEIDTPYDITDYVRITLRTVKE